MIIEDQFMIRLNFSYVNIIPFNNISSWKLKDITFNRRDLNLLLVFVFEKFAVIRKVLKVC